MTKTMGRLHVLAAAVLWSSSGIFAKADFFADWPQEWRGLIFAFWRALFAACILLPGVRGVRFRPLLVPMVLCFAGMNVTFLTAMVLSTAANAIWLQNLAPFWVLLATLLIFHEPMERKDVLPLIWAILGVLLILGFELSSGVTGSRVGVFCGVLSGVFYAGVVVTLRQLRGENPVWLTAINQAAAAILLVPVVLRLGILPDAKQLLWLGAFGALQMALPYILLSRGLRVVSSQEAVAIALTEPILSPVWAFLVWGERPAWWTLCGAALILTGLFLRYVVWDALAVSGPNRPDAALPSANAVGETAALAMPDAAADRPDRHAAPTTTDPPG